jgi:predicted RNA-binding protein with PUA-like domain
MPEQRWVFLADPTDYGWTELTAQKQAVWDGVKNAKAQANLKRCRNGDAVLIYHTAPDKAIVGVARVVGEARPDPKRPELVVVEVAPVKPLKRPLPLAELKADRVLANMSFVRMPRVAVQPVTAGEWERVMKLSGTKG